MKLTKILPKFLAMPYQEESLRRTEIYLEYHRDLVRNLEYRVEEGRAELDRLKRESWKMDEITKVRMKVTVIFSCMTAGFVVLSLMLNIMDDVGGQFSPWPKKIMQMWKKRRKKIEKMGWWRK